METSTDSRTAQRPAVGRTSVVQRGVSAVPRATPPAEASGSGTYVADNFTGDITATMGGTAALAHDGEPAGLARVTLAMSTAARTDPAPRRLIGLSLWAAALGIAGGVLAIRDGIGLITGAQTWFLPMAIMIGIAGVALTMSAFLTARQAITPWAMLVLATGALIANIVLATNAF